MKTTEYKPDWIAQHTLQMPLSYKRRNLVGLLTYLLTYPYLSSSFITPTTQPSSTL